MAYIDFCIYLIYTVVNTYVSIINKVGKGCIMKHINVKILFAAFVSLCALLFSACSQVPTVSVPSEPTSFSRPPAETTLSSSFENPNSSFAANELLWQTFTLDEYGMPEAYPEEFGGAYTMGGKLYIYLTDMRDEVQAWYMEACHNSTAVRFVEGRYTANYLQSLSSVVSEYTDKYSITSYGIDFANNCFSVGVYEEADRKALAAELDNPAIVIVPGAYVELT